MVDILTTPPTRPSVILSIALLAVVTLIALWDIYATSSGNPYRTVSDTMAQWSRSYPILPLIVGLIFGHIFWK